MKNSIKKVLEYFSGLGKLIFHVCAVSVSNLWHTLSNYRGKQRLKNVTGLTHDSYYMFYLSGALTFCV